MAVDTFQILNPKFVWDDSSTFEHPDLELLDNFNYTEDQLRETPLPKVEAFSNSSIQIVDGRQSFIKMFQTLRSQKEIGLDLRGHKKTKNILVVSISTATTDFILDMFKIKQDVGLLSEIFLNPQIVKIFGNKNHLNMFCRYLCLYFINVIDLETILKTCFNIKNIFKYAHDTFAVNRNSNSNVNYSVRPFTEETKYYCSASVHHFIYIYNDFKNRLIAKDEKLWHKMLKDCRVLCKKPCWNEVESICLNHAENQLLQQHEIQLQFLQELFEWRKRIAKEEKIDPEDVVSRTTLLRLTCIDAYTKSYFRLRFASGYISRDFDKLLKSYRQIKDRVVSANNPVYT